MICHQNAHDKVSQAKEVDRSMGGNPSGGCANARVHFAKMLPQVVLPHWLRLSATKATASDMATKGMVGDVAAPTHLLGDDALLPDKNADRTR
jgi:hypothetical protein